MEEYIGLISSTHFIIECGKNYDRLEDYENMESYYKLGVEMDDDVSMFNLGHYYDETGDVDNMLLYYNKAADKGDVDAMYNLGLYYELEKRLP